MRAVAAALEGQPFEEGPGNAGHSHAIDRAGVPEVHLEAARGLGRRDRQDPAVVPAGLLTRLHEEVWHRPAGRVEQAEVVQAAFGDHRLAALDHSKW